MNTAMHRAAEPDEDPTQWANPEEVTEVFIYLGSDESRNVNGKRFKAQEKDTWISTKQQGTISKMQELQRHRSTTNNLIG
ncbi:MAG: hypothetical protein M3298_07265, partial [Thermoproteota archaeon]|jgi:hypothetical protein|nr:hypothetical protein [Thermoproteota archaeon]